MKHVIIGGVAGGATAAARIRRADESAKILILEKGKHISYANCGLPYYIGGVITERENLLLQTPQSFGKRFEVDVRTGSEVVSVDTLGKTVLVQRSDGSEYTENYDKLLFSPGATPVTPTLEGINLDGIFTLRNVDDTDRIKNYITTHEVRKAVVVGAGFIGLEMAENLYHAGAEVAVVEMSNQVMAPIDFSLAAQVHQHLLQKGVALNLEQGVERFSRSGEKLAVHLNNGEIIHSDIVILSIGVRPETKLARKAGLLIGETGGIQVDEYLETSAKDVYAVGDAIEFPHPLTGKPWLNYLANPANRQGRIVADNMVSGKTTRYEGAIGTSIAKVFDLTVASTGLAGKRLSQLEIPFRSSWTHSGSHAGYYPGALPLSLKLTFDPKTGKLYGGQCVGYDGVDKRIDQIALVIKKGGTIYDLTQLEHAYAPPFSSAKDPVAIAGYVAKNIVSGDMPVITWREMLRADRQEVVIVDVRTRDEFSMGCIPGAINIPLDEIRSRLTEIPTGKPLLLYCAIGLRGYLAARILMGRGYPDVRNLSGGYKTYSIATTPVVRTEPVLLPEFKNENMEMQNARTAIKTVKVDACGLQCPGPVLRLKQAADSVAEGERIEIIATDAGFARDAQAWCNSTGNSLISTTEEKGRFTVVIEKGTSKSCRPQTSCDGKGKTLIMFSDDLDRALATFVLANGAAATGQKVTIFFTFWGLNVIKRIEKPKVKKDIFGKMFGMMLPSSSKKLKLSKMNMGGMGSLMMRNIMKRKNIDSLEDLRMQALAQGVEFIACQMSMDVMGVKKEELLDNVTIGGVATYMERADNANVNLFI
jgi:NADPH-dependent 2,4-dienoyl-CoA reductase/sulfur reductase-like enzyme/peroxiredoxin family protein/rhodanese-related sulfurtransferase/TusA-related sulfurtransferase